MATLSSFVVVKCKTFLYSIELLNNDELLDNFNFSTLDLKECLRSIFEAKFRGPGEVSETSTREDKAT